MVNLEASRHCCPRISPSTCIWQWDIWLCQFHIPSTWNAWNGYPSKSRGILHPIINQVDCKMGGCHLNSALEMLNANALALFIAILILQTPPDQHSTSMLLLSRSRKFNEHSDDWTINWYNHNIWLQSGISRLEYLEGINVCNSTVALRFLPHVWLHEMTTCHMLREINKVPPGFALNTCHEHIEQFDLPSLPSCIMLDVHGKLSTWTFPQGRRKTASWSKVSQKAGLSIDPLAGFVGVPERQLVRNCGSTTCP